MTLFHDQAEFLKAGDVEVGTLEAETLANALVEEEHSELQAEPFYACGKNSNSIKEAFDLLYVTLNYLNVTIGPDMAAKCWKELHANNMSKCVDGKLVKRADGKVLKPEGYVPFDIEKVLSS